MLLVVLILALTVVRVSVMTRARRITANLPEQLLEEAMKATQKGITERLVRRAHVHEKAMAMKGKIRLQVDLEESRERSAPRH